MLELMDCYLIQLYCLQYSTNENLISYLILQDLTSSIQPDVPSHLMSNRASELYKYKSGLVLN